MCKFQSLMSLDLKCWTQQYSPTSNSYSQFVLLLLLLQCTRNVRLLLSCMPLVDSTTVWCQSRWHWSNHSHSSTTLLRILAAHHLEYSLCTCTLSCITPHILSGDVLSKCYFYFLARIWSNPVIHTKSHYKNNVFPDVTIMSSIGKNV